MRKNLLIVLPIVLITSCKSIDPSALQSKSNNQNLLLPLETRIDFTGAAMAYPPIIQNMGDECIPAIVQTPDIRMFDATKFLENEIRNAITNNDSKKDYGEIICKVGPIIADNSAWPFISILTGCVFNVFGMPWDITKISLSVDVEIINSNGHTIGRYSGYGSDKKPIALYWGYKVNTAHRLSNINALKMALRDIKSQIEIDAEKLNTNLLVSSREKE